MSAEEEEGSRRPVDGEAGANRGNNSRADKRVSLPVLEMNGQRFGTKATLLPPAVIHTYSGPTTRLDCLGQVDMDQ